MESKLYFHVVAGKQTVNSLIDVYYPGLKEAKRETLAKVLVAGPVGAIGGAIVGDKIGKEGTKFLYELVFNDHN